MPSDVAGGLGEGAAIAGVAPPEAARLRGQGGCGEGGCGWEALKALLASVVVPLGDDYLEDSPVERSGDRVVDSCRTVEATRDPDGADGVSRASRRKTWPTSPSQASALPIVREVTSVTPSAPSGSLVASTVLQEPTTRSPLRSMELSTR